MARAAAALVVGAADPSGGWLWLLYSRRLSFYAPAQIANFYFAQAVA